MATSLSRQSIDVLADQVSKYLDNSIRQTGGVVDSILGIDKTGQPAYAVVPEGVGEMHLRLEALRTPGPFRESEDEIRSEFAARDIQAALFWGEAWAFPPNDDNAVTRYLAEGYLPSQHPAREEIVFLSAHWPLGGVGWLSTWRVDRRPSGDSLVSLLQHAADDNASPLAIVSSWVDSALPNPAPGE